MRLKNKMIKNVIKRIVKKLPYYKLLEEYRMLLDQHRKQSNDLYNELREKLEERLMMMQSRCDNTVGEVQRLESKCDNVRGQLERLKDVTDTAFERGFNDLLLDDVRIMKLNQILSVRPTLWGPENRLQISPLASMNTCFFNMNSGNIVIGDYTFAGSNVSVLTGSHDVYLQGLLRRDAEYKEGNDILIGRGVWLASNVTVLGPCQIGDNAVVAAGAVVTPGTNIPPNTIYGGVPARMISKIDVHDEQKRSKHLREAIERSDGLAFSDGWSERTTVNVEGEVYEGHWLEMNVGKAFLIDTECKMHYLYYGKEDVVLTVDMERNKACDVKLRHGGGGFTIKKGSDDEIEKVVIRCAVNKKELFVGMEKRETNGEL